MTFALIYCLLITIDSAAQTEVNIVKSIPLTVNSPISAIVTPNNNGKGFTYKTEIISYFDVTVNNDLTLQAKIEKFSNDYAGKGFELYSTTSYQSNIANIGLKFLLIFRKPN